MDPLYRPTAQLKIAITGRCTNDCVICFNDTRRRDNDRRVDLDPELLRQAIRDAAELGAAGVYWTGGEPLLRYRELVRLSAYAKSLGLVSSIVTNGGPLGAHGAYRLKNEALLRAGGSFELDTASMVAELLEAGVERVMLSIDSAHNTHAGVDDAPRNRVPTAVAARALSGLLDAGYGRAHAKQAIGQRLRITMTASGDFQDPSEAMLADVVAQLGLARAASGGERYGDARGDIVLKRLATGQVGAAAVLPERLVEPRRGEGLFTIRCANVKPRVEAYDAGVHHQDISINHSGEVALCGNFMYPIGDLREQRIGAMIDAVNAGRGEGRFAGSIAVLNRILQLGQRHGYGERAMGEAFRMVEEEAPGAMAGIASECGACNALGRQPRLQEQFVAAFDRRFAS